MRFQAIITKFHGPTNTKGSRITARASAGKVTVPWDYALEQHANHAAAAKALAEKFGWGGHWVSGGMPDGSGDVFVAASANRKGDLFKGSTVDVFEVAFSTLTREG